jgi:hypothetical protein
VGQEHGNDNVPLHGAWYIHIWTILVAAGKHHFPICLVGSGCQLLQTPWITILVKANPWLSRLSGSALAIGIAKYGSDNPSAFPNMEVTTTANRGCLWLSVGSRVGKFCTPHNTYRGHNQTRVRNAEPGKFNAKHTNQTSPPPYCGAP